MEYEYYPQLKNSTYSEFIFATAHYYKLRDERDCKRQENTTSKMSKKRKNKKKKKKQDDEESTKESEMSNMFPESNPLIPNNDSSNKTSQSEFTSTDISTSKDIRKTSTENFLSIQENLTEPNITENKQGIVEEISNQPEVRLNDKPEITLEKIDELIKKRTDGLQKETDGLKKEIAELKNEKESNENKFKSIFSNLSYWNQIFSVWYLRFLNEKFVNSFFSKTNFKLIEDKLYFGMNAKISTMFEILKMIKSKSYDLNFENIQIIIQNWEKRDFSSVPKDKWGIPKEGREAYYINKIKELSENAEMKEFFNQHKLKNINKTLISYGSGFVSL